MKLTTSHKVYLAILGLALTAFLVDRLVLGGGSGRAAAPASVSGEEAAPSGEQPLLLPSTDAGASSDKPSLADRFQALAGTADLDPAEAKDAFAPSKIWLTGPKATRLVTMRPSPGEEFAGKHRLTSVFMAREGSWATVDGKVIQVGQELEGFRLISVTCDSAIFRSGQDRVELKLLADATP